MLTIRVHRAHERVLAELTGSHTRRDVRERGVVRGRHATVDVEAEQPRVVALRQPLLHSRPSTVRGTVVDDDELVNSPVQRVEDRDHRPFLVVGGYDCERGDPRPGRARYSPAGVLHDFAHAVRFRAPPFADCACAANQSTVCRSPTGSGTGVASGNSLSRCWGSACECSMLPAGTATCRTGNDLPSTPSISAINSCTEVRLPKPTLTGSSLTTRRRTASAMTAATLPT